MQKWKSFKFGNFSKTPSLKPNLGTDTRHVFLISKSCIGYLLSNPSFLLSLNFFPMKDGCGCHLQAHLAFSSRIRRCEITRN
jgi:hypothetical protein